LLTKQKGGLRPPCLIIVKVVVDAEKLELLKCHFTGQFQRLVGFGFDARLAVGVGSF
jgi:hypothetical protein